MNLRRCGLPMGLGNRLAENSGQRGLPTFPQSARPTMEIWKTACWCYGWACGFKVLLQGCRRLTPITACCWAMGRLGWRRKMLIGLRRLRR